MVRASRVTILAGAVLLTASLALPTASLAQETEWVGGGTIGNFRLCDAGGWSLNDVEQVVAGLRPAGLDGNDPDVSGLSLTLATGSIWIGYSLFGLQYRPVDEYLQILGEGGAASNPVAMRRLAGATTNINANTQQVNFIADILHFADIENCEARVSLFLYR